MSSKDYKTPCQIFSCSPTILEEITENLSNLESENDQAKKEEKDYMVHILHQTLLLSLEISSSALICSLIMMMQSPAIQKKVQEELDMVVGWKRMPRLGVILIK